MKEIEVKRLLYQNSEAFKEGIEVGRKEALELVRKMRDAQKDVIYKSVFSPLVPTKTILYEVAKTKQITLEDEVDELLKEMEL